MAEAGCEAWYAADALAVMGLAEILRHLPRLLRLRGELLERLVRAGPDAFIGIDSPEFNLRVARALKGRGITTRGSVQGGTDLVFTIEAVDRPELKASGKARFIAPKD